MSKEAGKGTRAGQQRTNWKAVRSSPYWDTTSFHKKQKKEKEK